MYRTLAVAILLPWAALRAGDSNIDRATLKGLKSVNVVIDHLDPQLEEQGLTQEMLRSRVEEHLRKAAIPIDSNAREFVGMHITSMQTGKGPYSLCFSLAFYQPVTLARDPNIRTASQTWDVNAILVVPPKPMIQSVLNTADQLADLFVNAYRFVNP
jgi:hypothetical protein